MNYKCLNFKHNKVIYFLFVFLDTAAFSRDKGPWIIKPVASSRGRGVHLVNHVSIYAIHYQSLLN